MSLTRRIGLALSLAFADFARARLGLSCNLLVLDEVMQHMDADGQVTLTLTLTLTPTLTLNSTLGSVLLRGMVRFEAWGDWPECTRVYSARY